MKRWFAYSIWEDSDIGSWIRKTIGKGICSSRDLNLHPNFNLHQNCILHGWSSGEEMRSEDFWRKKVKDFPV